jgi:hypothetical protein
MGSLVVAATTATPAFLTARDSVDPGTTNFFSSYLSLMKRSHMRTESPSFGMTYLGGIFASKYAFAVELPIFSIPSTCLAVHESRLTERTKLI